MRRHVAGPLLAAALALPLTFLTAGQSHAVPADKAQVLSNWTQSGVGSYDAWNAARQNQASWSAYEFDWSTDYCTTSPDNPLGFPFKNACARHDFGYRNYKAAGTFAANKDRLDSAFYADLKRVCASYSGVQGSTCLATAWTYYQAVSALGNSAMIDGKANAR